MNWESQKLFFETTTVLAYHWPSLFTQFASNSTISGLIYGQSSGSQKEASKFDVLNTLPDLRHDFCVLWNQVMRSARNTIDEQLVDLEILGPIQNISDLHQDATSTATESWCPTWLPMPCTFGLQQS